MKIAKIRISFTQLKMERNKDVYIGTKYYRVIEKEQRKGIAYYILEDGTYVTETYQELWDEYCLNEATNVRCDESEICGEIYVWEQEVEKGLTLLKEALVSKIEKKMQQFQSMKERIQIGK